MESILAVLWNEVGTRAATSVVGVRVTGRWPALAGYWMSAAAGAAYSGWYVPVQL